MNANNIATKLELIEIVNKLFIYTDNQAWDKLKDEVFAAEVLTDFSSLGGQPAERLSSSEICRRWEEGFKDLDAIHHQSGNFLVEDQGSEASVYCYSIASHYKENAKKGTTRTFVGSYELGFINSGAWRIDTFTYNLKYMEGNLNLE